MGKPREWPNNAREARDQAAEHFAAIINLARPLLAASNPVTIVRAGRILDHAQNGIRHLERFGAQTLPDDSFNVPSTVDRGTDRTES